MKIVLVRHPPPDVASGVCYGRLDLPLRPDTADAVLMIAAHVARLSIAQVWSSPAIRCRSVAEAVATAAQVPLTLDPRLLELNFGAWEGCEWHRVPRASLDAWAADPSGFAPPGGETGGLLLSRVSEVHQAIRAAGEDCAVVSHGGPLKLLAALLRGDVPDLLAPAPPLGSIEVLTVTGPVQ